MTRIFIIAASMIAMVCSARAEDFVLKAPDAQIVRCLNAWIVNGTTFCTPAPADTAVTGTTLCQQHGDEIYCGGFPFGNGGATIQGDTYGCLPGEERVMRSDFSIGCAKDVHPQTWH